MRTYLTLILLVASLSWGCSGNDTHEPCTWKGSGFTATHSCGFGSFCLGSFPCGEGGGVEFSRCVSDACETDADCLPSHFCAFYSSSKSYCVPRSYCPAGSSNSSGAAQPAPVTPKPKPKNFSAIEQAA